MRPRRRKPSGPRSLPRRGNPTHRLGGERPAITHIFRHIFWPQVATTNHKFPMVRNCRSRCGAMVSMANGNYPQLSSPNQRVGGSSPSRRTKVQVKGLQSSGPPPGGPLHTFFGLLIFTVTCTGTAAPPGCRRHLPARGLPISSSLRRSIRPMLARSPPAAGLGPGWCDRRGWPSGTTGRLNGVEGVNGPVLVGVDVDVAVRSPECRTGGSRRGHAGPGSAGPEQVGRSRETKMHLAGCCSCLPQ